MLQKTTFLARLLFFFGFFIALFTFASKFLFLIAGAWHNFLSLDFFYAVIQNDAYLVWSGFFLMLVGAFLAKPKKRKIVSGLLAVAMLTVFYTVKPSFLHTHYTATSASQWSPNKEYVLVENDSVSRAYLLTDLAYFHLVYDSVGSDYLMISYCKMCRTLRVFNREHNGKNMIFNSTYAYQNNLILEDEATQSWWLQATGECIYGPLKGEKLKEWGRTTLIEGALAQTLKSTEPREIDIELDFLMRKSKERVARKFRKNKVENAIYFKEAGQQFEIPLTVFSEEKEVYQLPISDSVNATFIRLSPYSFIGFKTAKNQKLRVATIYGKLQITDNQNGRWAIFGEPRKERLPALKRLDFKIEQPFVYQRFILPSISSPRPVVNSRLNN